MTSVHTETLHQHVGSPQPTRGIGTKIGRGGILRLAVGALAILVLLALGALDAGRSTPDQAASDAASLAKPDFAPAVAYDGRGKWGGY